MNNKPEISVLVPCFNVEKYLKQCLDSILSQTFTDMEVICLNDGSTDNTPDILREYAVQDERVTVVNKPNSGYGATMNIGIEKASGKYVAIIESDDWVEPEMLAKLHEAAVRESLDVARCLYVERNDITGSEKTVRPPFPERYGQVFNPRELEQVFFMPPSIWVGLYDRDFLNRNGIRFLETPGASYQDTAFAFKVYAAARRVMIIPEVLHNYRINGGSSVSSPGKVFCVCDEEAEIRRYVKERGEYEELKEIMAFRCFGSYKWNYKRLSSLELKRNFMKRWSAEAKEMFARKEVTERFFSGSRMFRLRIVAFCPWMYHFKKKF